METGRRSFGDALNEAAADSRSRDVELRRTAGSASAETTEERSSDPGIGSGAQPEGPRDLTKDATVAADSASHSAPSEIGEDPPVAIDGGLMRAEARASGQASVGEPVPSRTHANQNARMSTGAGQPPGTSASPVTEPVPTSPTSDPEVALPVNDGDGRPVQATQGGSSRSARALAADEAPPDQSDEARGARSGAPDRQGTMASDGEGESAARPPAESPAARSGASRTDMSASPALARALEVERGVATRARATGQSRAATTEIAGAVTGAQAPGPAWPAVPTAGMFQQASPTLAAQGAAQTGATSAPPAAADADPDITPVTARALGAIARQRGGTLSMRLDPPSLGDLRVTMTVDRGSVAADIVVSTRAAHELLSGGLSTLREALERQGLVVERLTIHAQLARSEAQSNGSHGPSGASSHAPSHVDRPDARSDARSDERSNAHADQRRGEQRQDAGGGASRGRDNAHEQARERAPAGRSARHASFVQSLKASR